MICKMLGSRRQVRRARIVFSVSILDSRIIGNYRVDYGRDRILYILGIDVFNDGTGHEQECLN